MITSLRLLLLRRRRRRRVQLISLRLLLKQQLPRRHQKTSLLPHRLQPLANHHRRPRQLLRRNRNLVGVRVETEDP